MRKLCDIKREIELARNELDEVVLQEDGIERYYEKSTILDKLIEEYLEREDGCE